MSHAHASLVHEQHLGDVIRFRSSVIVMKALGRLQRRIRPFILRRLKSEVAQELHHGKNRSCTVSLVQRNADSMSGFETRIGRVF